MSYKQWAFNFFITVICLNIIVAILIVKATFVKNYAFQIDVFGVMSAFFLVSGIILGILSFKNKEKKDFKKLLGLYGNLVILLLNLVLPIIAFQYV